MMDLVPSRRPDAHDLDVDAPGTRPVKLGEEDGLEAAEGQLPTADAAGQASPHQRGTEVGAPVASLAVRETRIVVLVAGVVGHQTIHHRLEVLDEGSLEMVTEQGAGC